MCPKCGTRKSGQSSCCGRGGSWFEKCGDSGDDSFAHTWFEGITACKTKSKRVCILPGCVLVPYLSIPVDPCWWRLWRFCKFNLCTRSFRSTYDTGNPITPPKTTPTSGAGPLWTLCPKCGISPDGLSRSCCGAGGAWFGKCGGNKKHTWREGIDACKPTGKHFLLVYPSNVNEFS